jgi:uncharacterized protein (TIGR02453 family)
MIGISPAFAGFPREAIEFFKQLERHNERDWFLAHKDVYDRACRQPMEQLVAELGPGKSKISRIYRDIRFSSDKSPYKTHISAGVGGNYIHLSSHGLYVGTGMYLPDSARLERFRAAIGADGSGRQLARIVATLQRKGYAVDTHETLKSAPKGYRADHPRIDLLRMKDIFGGKSFKPSAWLSTPKALERIKQVIVDIKPLTEWLQRHAG